MEIKCVMCRCDVEPYSCSRKRCTQCIGLKKCDRVFGQCAYCGTQAWLTKDHIVPKSRGGSSSPDNIVLVCQWCNEDKGALLLHEWLQALPIEMPQHYYVNTTFSI